MSWEHQKNHLYLMSDAFVQIILITGGIMLGLPLPIIPLSNIMDKFSF